MPSRKDLGNELRENLPHCKMINFNMFGNGLVTLSNNCCLLNQKKDGVYGGLFIRLGL